MESRGGCLSGSVFTYLLYSFAFTFDDDQVGGDIEQGPPRSDSSEDDDEAVPEPLKEVLWSDAAPVSIQDRQDDEGGGGGGGEEERNNISSSQCCCICLEEFKSGDMCKVRSNCNHIYHKSCINVWLIWDKHCPLCRGYIQVEDDE
ncbi:hypothetical protein Ddye_024842 [Dipteronia dyeriana]|uniref:RING-type domain-containing protein n=1 Tax=Dipteronia dyeriana TaxID=168575 RepID=A0AAD9WTC8_9ROSI|nr:hypothetical protein Ddye_024842 [Dipteronia dyeriana]